MKKYIQIYDNVVSKKNCDSLIEKFEVSKDQHVATDLENHRHFTEININQHQDWKMMEQGTYLHLRPMIQRYKDDCKITDKQWPEKYGFEEIRFKRYLPNDKDEFKEHVDVGDYASARRFLVFFLYLNNTMDLQDERPPDRGRQIRNIVIVFFLFYFVTYCTVIKING